MSELSAYRGRLLPAIPSPEQLQQIVPDYTTMLLTILSTLADRYDRRPDYPFIDTKLDLMSGRDFPPEDPVRGLDTIYGWIQGRGLEALAGHCIWLENERVAEDLIPRLRRMMREILAQLRRMRQRNANRLSFFMSTEGEPFTLDENGRKAFFEIAPDAPHGFSDLFCAKGMLAAGLYLGDESAVEEANAYCLQVDESIRDGRFANDQQPLDPDNEVLPVPGKHPHGPYMIQLGTAALLTEGAVLPDAVEFGLRLLRHEFAHHVNLNGRHNYLEEYDFWESIDDRGMPYRDAGTILCDPGHALEFVGLALKFTRAARSCATAEQLREIDSFERHLPPLLERIFALGFQPGSGGICKAVDLLSRRPLNTDMPWWNLPETMRAAALCHRITGDPAPLHILSACHNAFIGGFVRPEIHLMAVQTRNAAGEAIPVIPATADADPGYHTGLSIIDMLTAIPSAHHPPE